MAIFSAAFKSAADILFLSIGFATKPFHPVKSFSLNKISNPSLKEALLICAESLLCITAPSFPFKRGKALTKISFTAGPFIFFSFNANFATNVAANLLTVSSFNDLLINIKLVKLGIREASLRIFLLAVAFFAFSI